jgi:hypothetical protein
LAASVLIWNCVLIGICLSEARAFLTDENAPKSDLEARSKQRLEVMHSAINDFKISSEDIRTQAPLKFAKAPLLRYNDQTRELLDATVWRVGESGRPTAIVTLEIYAKSAEPVALVYEFVSLSPARLSMESPRGPRWAPSGTDLKMAALANAPRTADSKTTRLAQMRQMARRFEVREQYRGDKVECRLLSTPIDRYGGEKDTLDGAIFIFANGTNPEVGLVLECRDNEWSYGMFRLGGAALSADLDGKPCYEAPAMRGGVSNRYATAAHAIILPE